MTRRDLARDPLLLLALVTATGIVSVLIRQDANWDLQNYHYYNPWAWLNGRLFGVDLVAAQLQTFHNPLFDFPFYFMVSWGWRPALVAFVLAIPTGVAAFFLVLTLRWLFADLTGTERRVAIWSAFTIGMTSSMGRATLGTTMNEWPVVALSMGALWLLVRALVAHRDAGIPIGALLVSGALLGIATGGKLTAGTFAVAMCAAIVLRGPHARIANRARIREAIVFGFAVLAGFALTYGPWAWALWTNYGSPIFPYANEWIESPWWANAQVIGRRYGPHGLVEWLRFPLDMLSPKPYFVSEVGYRDPRMPLLYVLALGCGFVWLWVWLASRRQLPAPADAAVSRAWRFVVAFFVVAFVLWGAQHSNYRYIIVLDLLAGALIVTLLQRNLRAGHAPPMIIFVAFVVVAFTQRATWGRVDFGDEWFDVRGPKLESNALVVMATNAPMAHVVPFLTPAPARVVGIDNGIMNAEHVSLLEDAVNSTIRNHPGPIYALSDAAQDGTAALAARGLRTLPASCETVHSNLAPDPLTICRVERHSAATPPQ